MTRLRVCSFAISLEGYGAGPDQDLDNLVGIEAFRAPRSCPRP
jgi:hypothetical protein